jgi:hypothetical protein
VAELRNLDDKFVYLQSVVLEIVSRKSSKTA